MRKQAQIAIAIGTVLGVLLFGAATSWLDKAHSASSNQEEAARPKPPKQLNLSYGFSAGWLLNHDLYVRNTSGEELTEAHLTITFVGEDGSPSVQRYWADWPLGEQREISVPVDRVKNVQRILVEGRSEQGVMAATLTPTR